MNVYANTAAEVMRQLLIDIGQGNDGGTSWPVFDSNEPNAPDNVITCYDTQGIDDGRSNLDGTLWAHLGVQIRVRSMGVAVGRTKANAVRKALSEAIRRTVWIGTAQYWVSNVARIGQVLALGKEKPDSNRNIFTLNVLLPLEVIP